VNFGQGFFRENFNTGIFTTYIQQSGINGQTIVVLSSDPGQVITSINGQTLVNPCPASAPLFLSNGLCGGQAQVFGSTASAATTVVQAQPQFVQQQPQIVVPAPAPVVAPTCLCGQDLINLQNQVNTLQTQLNAHGMGGLGLGIYNTFHHFDYRHH
jgi:hypothetical protein